MDPILSTSYRIKILLITLAGWLIIYFFVNRLQVDPSDRLDLGTWLDKKIPYRPQFALIYFSTYIFVLIPFLTLSKTGQFYRMLASFAAISILASLVHALIPSKIERVEEVKAKGLTGWLLSSFQKTCKPYGNFPSMHVGLSVPVVAASFLTGGPIVGITCLLWAIMIALSTLYTKQHYVLDVLAGLLGGAVIFSLTTWLMWV